MKKTTGTVRIKPQSFKTLETLCSEEKRTKTSILALALDYYYARHPRGKDAEKMMSEIEEIEARR